ncbi:SDR family NAD(P)-dependent oxidoreductase [Streptomyces sp. NPDC090025]|uniref:SDR family NAD(P)-dependent oxidoreductase n=1 Tax=Streptomyces sp. NPDC090025 TaxID=3365922 RepID=UPI003837D682
MSQLFDLSGRTAVITGSSRGIGLGVARALLEEGASVLVHGHDEAETAAALEALRARHPSAPGARPRVAALAGDVTDADLARGLVAEAVRVFGHLDHLVCNAGVDIVKPAVDYLPEEWDHVVAVNLRGAFQPAQAAARHWIAEGSGGSVTMTSSAAGVVGIPMLAPYAASKGGVNQLVRTLAAEWATHAIRVNAIAPGHAAPVMDGVTLPADPASDRRAGMLTPLGRRATVWEIAAPYVFLASPAAWYVTGSVLAVDGGYSAV